MISNNGCIPLHSPLSLFPLCGRQRLCLYITSNDSKKVWASSVRLFPLREQRVEEIAVGKLGITQH
jgi:hypothetical protein